MPGVAPISAPDFVREVREDFNSPTTSNFVNRIPQCKETVAKLEEVRHWTRRRKILLNCIFFSLHRVPFFHRLFRASDATRALGFKSDPSRRSGVCLPFPSSLLAWCVVRSLPVRRRSRVQVARLVAGDLRRLGPAQAAPRGAARQAGARLSLPHMCEAVVCRG